MPFFELAGGRLEAVVGPMFSGKSEELIRRVKRALIAKQEVQVFKPALDDRYARSAVASHSGQTIDAEPVEGVEQIRATVNGSTQVVAPEVCQFRSEHGRAHV